MEVVLHFWPLLAFISSLFIGGLGIAVGLTLWIMGKLEAQDARRIEMKETILVELRERHHMAIGRMDMQHSILDEKIDDMRQDFGNRLTRIETVLNGRIK